jgi:hypothetical protein
MQCDFLLPGLLGAPSSCVIKDIAPALAKLLARGSSIAENIDSTEAWIAQRFELTPVAESLAFAAIALLGEPEGSPGQSHWLRADPVHLSVNRDRVVLLDASQLEITATDANALCRSLQDHFVSDGLRFHVAHPERWYIQSDDPITLHTRAPSVVRGRSVANYWFDGADRALWQGRLSEMQMLLHAHPVNEAREEAGQLPINGVWFWGAGALPDRLEPIYSHIIAHDALLAGLASLTQSHYTDSDDFHWSAGPIAASGQTLIALHQLDTVAAYSEWDVWGEALAALDQAWFAPALSALENAKIAAVTIHAPDKNHGAKITTTRYDLFKFWRHDFVVEH